MSVFPHQLGMKEEALSRVGVTQGTSHLPQQLTQAAFSHEGTRVLNAKLYKSITSSDNFFPLVVFLKIN